MVFLRFLVLLSVAIWLGALLFFPVVAQTAFLELPSHSAGMLVRGTLIELHWFGLFSGLIFLAASMIYDRMAVGRAQVFVLRHMLVLLMLALTAISQFHILPRMDLLRISAGEIAMLAPGNPVRAQFGSLHAWSVRIESAVLVLGLLVLYSVAQRLSSSGA